MIILLVFSCVYDIRKRIIPNFIPALILILGIIGLIFSFADRESSGWTSLLVPHAVGFAAALAVCVASRLISRDGLGMGDVKLLISLGFTLGFSMFTGALLITAAAAFITGVLLMILKRADKNTALPFAPFIAVGFSAEIITSLIKTAYKAQ